MISRKDMKIKLGFFFPEYFFVYLLKLNVIYDSVMLPYASYCYFLERNRVVNTSSYINIFFFIETNLQNRYDQV